MPPRPADRLALERTGDFLAHTKTAALRHLAPDLYARMQEGAVQMGAQPNECMMKETPFNKQSYTM